MIAELPLPLLRIVIVALVSPLTGFGQVMVRTTASPLRLPERLRRADRRADIGAAVAAGGRVEADVGADGLREDRRRRICPLIETPVSDGCPVSVQVTWFGLSLAFRCTVPPPENDPSKRLRNSRSAALPASKSRAADKRYRKHRGARGRTRISNLLNLFCRVNGAQRGNDPPA